MNSTDLLLIFVRNPRLGQVKTRLANTVGDEKALEIYLRLLDHTAEIANKCTADKTVFYSEFIDDLDKFQKYGFSRALQTGEGLGDRLHNAFKTGFSKGHERVIVIGSDCYELSTEVLEKAFRDLETHDAVIGPAKDGGYYLLGMRNYDQRLFEGKKWSTENVFLDSVLDFKELNWTYSILLALNDVDVEDDLGELKEMLKEKREDQS